MHLDGDMSFEELEEAIARFRGSHAHVNIVIYDSEQIFSPGNESDWTR